MNSIKYACLAMANLVFTGLAYLLAPLYVPFCKSDGYLPNWLTWFQTFDAPLDAGWRDGYFRPAGGIVPTGFALYWLRVRWCWRNPAYGFCYYPLGIPFVASDWTVTCDIALGAETLFVAKSKDGYFCYMYGGSLGELKLGWKVLHQWKTAPDGTRSWSNEPWGPLLRSPLAFTPKCVRFWQIRKIFQGTSKVDMIA